MKTFMKFNKITRQGVSKVKPKAWFKSTFLYIDVGTSAFGPSCTEFVAQGIFSVSPQSCSPGGFREVHRSITDGQTHRQSDFLSSWSKLTRTEGPLNLPQIHRHIFISCMSPWNPLEPSRTF